MKKCQKCSNELEDHMKFCGKCGKKIIRKDKNIEVRTALNMKDDNINQEKSGYKKSFYLMIVLVIILLLIGDSVFRSKENEGTIKYDDCRDVVIYQNQSELPTYGKVFTCSYIKTQTGKVMSGICVNTEIQNGVCTKAYIYKRKQDDICANPLKPYLGIDDVCYSEQNDKTASF